MPSSRHLHAPPRTTPAAVPIAEAMQDSAALERLGARLKASNAAFAAVRPLLPETLAGHVRAGPIDDDGWSLLCANASVAAKLRQLAPRLERHLHDAGRGVGTVRIKVDPS